MGRSSCSPSPCLLVEFIFFNPQSAIRNPQSVDPDNRLLWRMNRRRLEAETLWDALHARFAGELAAPAGLP